MSQRIITVPRSVLGLGLWPTEVTCCKQGMWWGPRLAWIAEGLQEGAGSCTSSLWDLAQAADFQALVFVFVFRDNNTELMVTLTAKQIQINERLAQDHSYYCTGTSSPPPF